MKRTIALGGLLGVVSLVTAFPAWAGYSDVPGGHWAARAVSYTAEDRDWMTTGAGTFRPEAPLSRRDWSRALVKAFAPEEAPDPTVTFYDLTPDDPDFTFAAVAVKRGWLTASNGSFLPDGGVSKRIMDRSLVLALGLQRPMTALHSIATADGVPLKHLYDFSYLMIAQQLRLHYNHPTPGEQSELLPATIVRRADGAYALYKAVSARGTWLMSEVQRYESVVLPVMTPARRAAVEFAFAYAGYPYVYAGEWFRKTPDAYCCGAQKQGGFDCSGWAWWVLRAPGGGWDNTSVRPYAGWRLPERSSSAMAKATGARLPMERTAPLDLLFFDTDSSSSDGTNWSSVDHVGLSLGSGWMIHSSGGRGGVALDWVGDGWWRAHYRWARRIVF